VNWLSVGYLPVMVVCDGHPNLTPPVAPSGGRPIQLPIPNYPEKLRSSRLAFSGEVTIELREGMILSAYIGGGDDIKQRDLFAQALMSALRRISFPRDWPEQLKMRVLFTTDACNAIHLPKGSAKKPGAEMQSHYGR